MYNLTFRQLRLANIARLPHFKNRKGEPAHAMPDGSDWSLGEWSNAVLGELGEAANLIKKLQRGDLELETTKQDLADELADVVTYLDILAFRAGIDLGEATGDKWDVVSARIGLKMGIAQFKETGPAQELKHLQEMAKQVVDAATPLAGYVVGLRAEEAC